MYSHGQEKGYAKRGAALILNQETPKWIANRNAQVEGVYVRSGHNFSPDWMARTTYGEIEVGNKIWIHTSTIATHVGKNDRGLPKASFGRSWSTGE